MFKNIDFSTKKKQEAILMSIWKSNSQRIYKTCLQMCRDKELAKDLQQEIFIKIFNNIHELKDYEYKEAWIQYVCRNHCRDYFRRQRCRPEYLVNEINEPYEVEEKNFDLDKNLAHNIEQAFKTLNVLERMILQLHYIGGLDRNEISKIFGLSKSSINLKIRKALKKTNSILKNEN